VQSAQDRGLEFDLTFAQFRSLFRRRFCPYSGRVMSTRDGDEDQATVDRIDASLGYVHGNVILCSRRLNAIKSNLTAAEMNAMYRVVRRRKLR